MMIKKRYFLICPALLLLLSIPSKVWSQENKTLLTDNPLKSHLDSAVQNASATYMATPGTVGLSIAVYQNGQRYLYSYGESKKGTGHF
ncbi:hypothetical protein [Pedobacter sp. B4-66]|uniref:hypothetical protein n=1 Tax=Pedobacter sp. B4-66 TaxID=2817280 RepID=UPI001BDA2DDC|nr:hypothetical protein [Pedobacter sp. B4-66]